VTDLRVDEKDNVYITIQMDEGVSIRKDSVIKIGASIMGEAYIDVSPGEGEIVASGETIRGDDAGIAQQIEDVVTSLQDLIKSEKITSSLDNLDKTLKNAALVSETIANDRDKMDSIISHLEEMTNDEQVRKIHQITENLTTATQTAEDILAENEKTIKDIATNIESITDNLYILSADLKRNPWKVVWKSKEQDVEKYALNDAIVRLKEAEKNLAALNEKNEKVSDEDLEEIRALIQNLQVIQKSTAEYETIQETKPPRRQPFGR
jgi:ABC-type transporter Mla subunit MlaD